MSRKLPFFQSLYCSIKGIVHFFRLERNAWIEAIIAVIVVAFGLFFNITATEWMIVIICIGMVFASEMVNTAIEQCCDMIRSEHHPVIGIIKDLAAGAVLVVSIASMAVGLIIFLPRLLAA